MIHKIGPYVDFDSNIYLLTGERNVLIDTGSGYSSTSIIDDIENILGESELDLILLTHCHFDHVGGAYDITSKFGS